VQKMDGKELQDCIARPCIYAEDECYNCEWSTELTVPMAEEEYIKGYFACIVLAKEFGISNEQDFAYNMSVGYDLEGIKTPKIDTYIETMKDASNTQIFKECKEYLKNNISMFKNFTIEDLEKISPNVCKSITLSTLHGCPASEIEKIAHYLLTEKKVNVFIKCNPTLLGYEFARNTLDSMGYDYIAFDDHHFKNDLQYADAVAMFKRLMATAKEIGKDIIFLRKVLRGGTDQSYGIHVAKLAGVPKDVIRRANRLLLDIESRREIVNISEKEEIDAMQQDFRRLKRKYDYKRA